MDVSAAVSSQRVYSTVLVNTNEFAVATSPGTTSTVAESPKQSMPCTVLINGSIIGAHKSSTSW